MDRDINDVFDDILLTEERAVEQGYEEGHVKGEAEGNAEAYHFGYHRGAEIGEELGYYAVITAHLLRSHTKEEKLVKLLSALTARIEAFPRENDPDVDIVEEINQIRSFFKRCCSAAKFKCQTFPKKNTISF